MAKLVSVDIVTRERTVLSTQVVSVMAPGVEGYFGVRPGHAPFMTELGVGKLILRNEHAEELVLAVSGGFFEVSSEHATVLCETAELASEIDPERARSAVNRARERLSSEGGHGGIDVVRARMALHRALNRLDVA